MRVDVGCEWVEEGRGRSGGMMGWGGDRGRMWNEVERIEVVKRMGSRSMD